MMRSVSGGRVVIRKRAAVLCAAVLCLALPGRAVAQGRSRPNLGVGYSFLREADANLPNSVTYPAGWLVALATTPRPIGIVIEAGGNYRSPANTLQKLHALLVGVRITGRTDRHIVPFGQALVGSERYTEPGYTENDLAFQPGAGLDFPASDALAFRVQGDVRIVRTPGSTLAELRAAGSLVIALGRR
jgi:hypothetical protein